MQIEPGESETVFNANFIRYNVRGALPTWSF